MKSCVNILFLYEHLYFLLAKYFDRFQAKNFFSFYIAMKDWFLRENGAFVTNTYQ